VRDLKKRFMWDSEKEMYERLEKLRSVRDSKRRCMRDFSESHINLRCMRDSRKIDV